MKNYPLYCPRCKQETLINVKDLQVTVIKEPDALDAEVVCPFCGDERGKCNFIVIKNGELVNVYHGELRTMGIVSYIAR